MKIDDIVQAMEPPRYTTTQAAMAVGKSPDTLKRWKQDGVYHPSEHRKFGALSVDLYTVEDIVQLKKVARSMRPGRKPGMPKPGIRPNNAA